MAETDRRRPGLPPAARQGRAAEGNPRRADTRMEGVERQSTYLKGLFFLYFVGFGIGTPFFSIFFKHVVTHADGRPAIALIGLIFFAMPLVSLIANVPAGVLADKFRSGKSLIASLCFGAALFSVLIGWSGEEATRSWTLENRFLFIFLLMILLNCCFFPIGPMIDAETLLFLNRHSRREFYGTYRLWGTYGWSVSTILMGFLLHRFAHDPLIFYGSACSFILLGVVARSGVEARPTAPPIVIPWMHLRKDRVFQGFLGFVFLVGLVSSASYVYTGYFFDDVMKSPMEIGWILGTWTILEIPVMKMSRRLIERFGNRRLILAGLLLNGVRLLLFSLFTRDTPLFWKWGAALLQGPGFGLTHIGVVDFVDRRAHPEMRATYMGIVNVARMSLASSLGGMGGSWLIGQWGGATLMQACGVASIVLMLAFGGVVKERRSRTENGSEDR